MKLLVVGLGSIGKRHARLASELKWNVATVSAYPKNEYVNFNNIEQAISTFTPDAIIVSRATSEHYSIANLIEQTARDSIVLIEKPLFDKPSNFIATRNQFFVAYNLRFHPIYKLIKNELVGQRIIYAHITAGSYLPNWREGTDYKTSYSAKPELGGGVINDLSHEIDCINDWFGVSSVNFIHKENSRTLEIESEDLSLAVLNSNSGAPVFLHMDYLSRIPFRKGTIHCENKTIQYDFMHGTFQVSKEKTITIETDRDFTYKHQLLALFNDRKSLCSLEDGTRVMEVIKMMHDKSSKDLN